MSASASGSAIGWTSHGNGGSRESSEFHGALHAAITLLGICYWREAPETAVGRAGGRGKERGWLLANDDGRIELIHSVSAGLDHAATGPEHAFLQEAGRVECTHATDDEALAGFKNPATIEGIIPALETAHAMAYVLKVAGSLPKSDIIIVNVCGRGDKDMDQAMKYLFKDGNLLK
jgi:tryptophan synthase beta chain